MTLIKITCDKRKPFTADINGTKYRANVGEKFEASDELIALLDANATPYETVGAPAEAAPMGGEDGSGGASSPQPSPRRKPAKPAEPK